MNTIDNVLRILNRSQCVLVMWFSSRSWVVGGGYKSNVSNKSPRCWFVAATNIFNFFMKQAHMFKVALRKSFSKVFSFDGRSWMISLDWLCLWLVRRFAQTQDACLKRSKGEKQRQRHRGRNILATKERPYYLKTITSLFVGFVLNDDRN